MTSIAYLLSKMIITIKLLDHYGQIRIIPIECIVDRNMERTLHTKQERSVSLT